MNKILYVQFVETKLWQLRCCYRPY